MMSRLRGVQVLACSLAAWVGGCGSPVPVTDAGVDAPARPDAPAVDAWDAPPAMDAHDAAPDLPDLGPEAGADAWEADASDAANACVLAHGVCVAATPFTCVAPDFVDTLHSCGVPGQECCRPASGGPIACAIAGGTCVPHDLTSCASPNHIGPSEIYVCEPAGDVCCLPPS